MISHPRGSAGHKFTQKLVYGILMSLLLSCGFFFSPLPAFARSNATPWSNDVNFQNLACGSSSTADVVRVMGAPPDEIVREEQMVPVLENFYYYDENKSGAATVFIFENGFLAGMQLKTAGNQYIDLTYFLPNNGDRQFIAPSLGGYMPYYPDLPFTTW